MDTEPVIAPQLDDQVLVALTPADMTIAQQDLGAWCDQKITAVRRELTDIEANLELATEHGWKYASVASALRRTEQRIVYYEKLKAAVAAGYLIVPNFPVDLLAVRVKRARPRAAAADWASSGAFDATAELLPAGEGRYVDNRVETTAETYEGKNHEGKPVQKTRYRSDGYDNVDMPLAIIKPVVMEAAARAMALRLFDQIGIVRNVSGRDPIIVGQLLDPRGNGRRVTFFVAWWLDTSTL